MIIKSSICLIKYSLGAAHTVTYLPNNTYAKKTYCEKVQLDNDQEKTQSKRIPTPKTETGKTKLTIRYFTQRIYHKPSEQLFPNRRPHSYPNLS